MTEIRSFQNFDAVYKKISQDQQQVHSVFSKSGGYGPEICYVTSKLIFKSRDILYVFHKQTLLTVIITIKNERMSVNMQ